MESGLEVGWSRDKVQGWQLSAGMGAPYSLPGVDKERETADATVTGPHQVGDQQSGFVGKWTFNGKAKIAGRLVGPCRSGPTFLQVCSGALIECLIENGFESASDFFMHYSAQPRDSGESGVEVSG